MLSTVRDLFARLLENKLYLALAVVALLVVLSWLGVVVIPWVPVLVGMVLGAVLAWNFVEQPAWLKVFVGNIRKFTGV